MPKNRSKLYRSKKTDLAEIFQLLQWHVLGLAHLLEPNSSHLRALGAFLGALNCPGCDLDGCAHCRGPPGAHPARQDSVHHKFQV